MTTPSTHPRHVVVIGAGPGPGAAVAHRFGREGEAALRNAVAVLHEQLADDGVHVASGTVR